MSDEELSLRHRRASEASAGAPSAATRAAIRREAEAQAAARRALPDAPTAANDSHWPMRAVAGLAVVAIAAGLWWQMRPQLTPPVSVEPQAAAMRGTDRRELVRESPAVPPPAVSAVAPRRSAPARAESVAAAKVAANRAAESQAVAAPVAAAGATAERAPAPLAAAAATADAATAPQALADEIARRLPDAWNSATPVDGLWVRVDAEGKVVDAGGPADGLRLARSDGESIAVVNARGVALRISVRRERAQR